MKRKPIIITSLIILALVTIFFSAVFIMGVKKGQTEFNFMKTADFIILEKEDNKIKITDKNDLKLLWNSLNYRFFMDFYEYSNIGDEEENSPVIFVTYATKKPSNGYSLSFGFEVYKNGIVGRAMTLRSYVKYKMPKYSKTVFYLYKKYSNKKD